MFSIYDGRDEFYQWDKDRKLIVDDETIKEVHFCNKTDECSLVCEVYDLDNLRVVDVPNVLLTTDWRINVYGYTEDYTKHSECFKVNARTKPADYVYTETEVLNYNSLLERIENLEENGTGGGGSGGGITQEELEEALYGEDSDIVNNQNLEQILSDYPTFGDVETYLTTSVDEGGIKETLVDAVICSEGYELDFANRFYSQFEYLIEPSDEQDLFKEAVLAVLPIYKGDIR